MKQILQNLRTGTTEIVDVPVPAAMRGQALIRTSRTLVSAGTERMLIEFGKASFIDKARQQPDKVKQVLDKIRTDGLAPTLEAVKTKLDQPITLGYCNVGTVLEHRAESTGQGMCEFVPGERVVSNGPHAEIVCAPKNLCARVPDEVSDEEAAFAVPGAIGLQGIRLAQPTIGECFVVTGLGLIGLITVQLLKANGCRVFGIDLDSTKCKLARQFGAETADISIGEDPLVCAEEFSRGRGVDGVLITAATKSSEPVHQAALMCRKQGRIVLVGVTGLNLSRDDFYKKELSFQISCSYGPGRYDPEYEDNGRDYPFGYVRWTEQRNFEAVLDMMAAGRIDVKPLISHRFSIDEAEKAYDVLSGKKPYLGIILEYGEEQKGYGNKGKTLRRQEEQRTIQLNQVSASASFAPGEPVIGLIGAGNFTGQVLLPAIGRANCRLRKIVSGSGVSGTHLGKKFGFEYSSSDAETVFSDPGINTVFITTRHNSHAKFVLEALRAGKHVFVEKPLCLFLEELDEIEAVKKLTRSEEQSLPPNPLKFSPSPLLMVGFNRRFAPHVRKMKELLSAVHEPISMIMTVNAGAIPKDHWTQDPQVGGGRIVGEACHFIDLLRFLAESRLEHSEIMTLDSGLQDTFSIQLRFQNGSIATIHYFANGNKRFPKERLEVFAAGKILQLDNYRSLHGYGWKNFKTMKLWRQDKGHRAEVAAFLDAVRSGGPAPIPFDEIVEVTRVSIQLAGCAR